MIDLHCHILPGLDDGPAAMAESVEMARVAAGDGITAIAATPHLFRGTFPGVDLPVVAARRSELTAALREAAVPVEILQGAEIHVSHDLVDSVRRHKTDLVLGGSSYVFVEFPSDHVFSDAKGLLFGLTSEGVLPVIAHPERNLVFARRPDLLAELEGMGALAQANAGSLLGAYGSDTREAVARLLRAGLIHVIASDGHDPVRRPPKLSEAMRAAAAVLGDGPARALVEDNPRAILDDRDDLPYRPEPDVRPEGSAPRSGLGRIFGRRR